MKKAPQGAFFSVSIVYRHAGRLRKRKVNLSNMDSSAYEYTVESMFGESKQKVLKAR